MGQDTYETLKRLSTGRAADEEFVSFDLSLRMPDQINYSISNLERYRNMADPDLYERQMSVLHGLEANFEFELHGQIDYPEELDGIRCHLMVNASGPSEYLEHAGKNKIGDGWFEHNVFLFRLYISPEITNDLFKCFVINRRLRPQEDHDDKAPDDIHIQLDLAKFKRGALVLKGAITYNIIGLFLHT